MEQELETFLEAARRVGFTDDQIGFFETWFKGEWNPDY